MALSSNTRLGRYEIRSPLGAGGMGEVYLARDPKINRDVAIKVLPAAFSSDLERLRRFEQEAQATGALNHPNILAIYDVDTHDGSPYVVSELLEGGTLREHLNGSALPVRKALDYALQIASGLTAAHLRGIVHRDLKPENLFVTKDGRVKILDFGLAKLIEKDNGSEALTDIPTRKLNTDPGTVVGTIGYMSPEQVRTDRVDHRSDIFSLGVILYLMLSGKRAFRGESTIETLNAILKEDPPKLSESNNQINPALERVVMHCLEKSPEQRFHSARDVAFALEALSGLTSSRTVTAALPLTTGRPKNRERLPWIAATAILLLALIVALPLVIGYFRRAPTEVSATRLVIPASPKQALFSPSISPDGRRLVYSASTGGNPQLWVRSLDSLTAQPLAATIASNTPRPVFWSPDGRYIGFFADSKLKKMEITGGPAQTLADVPTSHGGSWNREGVIIFCPNATSPLYRISATGGEATQLTSLDESHHEINHRWPFFLPDDRHFLFLARSVQQKESTAIYVGSLDSKETKRITSADSNVSYVPPGYLLFTREATLMAQPFDADKLKVTGDAFPVVERVRYNWGPGLSEFSVSSNGALVYISGNPVPSQLTWFDRSGKQFGTVGPPAAYRVLRLSPDEKRVAVERTDPPGVSSDIWLIESERGVSSRLTSNPGNDLYPVWSPDGIWIAFSSIREGQFKLYQKLSRGAGGEEELLKFTEPGGLWDWSADGRFILYRVLGGKTKNDVWVLPMFGDRKPYPLLQTEFQESGARFSPGGRWVAYVSDETGTPELYIQEFQGSGGKLQVSNGGGNFPRWRRDGKELFYNSGGKLMVVDIRESGSRLEPGVPKLLFERSGVGIFDASGDGQRFLIPVLLEESSPEPITVVLNWTADLKR
jgi:serine/threonine protein kinase